MPQIGEKQRKYCKLLETEHDMVFVGYGQSKVDNGQPGWKCLKHTINDLYRDVEAVIPVGESRLQIVVQAKDDVLAKLLRTVVDFDGKVFVKAKLLFSDDKKEKELFEKAGVI